MQCVFHRGGTNGKYAGGLISTPLQVNNVQRVCLFSLVQMYVLERHFTSRTFFNRVLKTTYALQVIFKGEEMPSARPHTGQGGHCSAEVSGNWTKVPQLTQ